MKQKDVLWLKELYLGPSVKEKEKQIKKHLFRRALQPDLQVLMLSQSKQEQIEVMPAVLFRQKHFPQLQWHLLGLAAGKEEAFSLVQEIAEETYRETGDCDMKTYLLQKEYQ